jgi:Fibronectin type III domain
VTGLPPTRNHNDHRRSVTAAILSLVLGMVLVTLSGCGTGADGGPQPPSTSSTTGATAQLEWDPVPDPTVTGYNVYFGKQSAGQPGLCAYQNSQFVMAPQTTVTGLDPDTQYFFAVSAYNGLESPCSEEVSTVTAPTPAQDLSLSLTTTTMLYQLMPSGPISSLTPSS